MLTKEMRPAIRSPRSWAITVLQEEAQSTNARSTAAPKASTYSTPSGMSAVYACAYHGACSAPGGSVHNDRRSGERLVLV